MRLSSLLAVLVIQFSQCVSTFAVTIPTVPVGNPGNLTDTRYIDSNHPDGIGAVTYAFRIGASERAIVGRLLLDARFR